MAAYLFILHSNEQSFERVEQECGDDAEALMVAMELAFTCGVDVWRGERIVVSMAQRYPARVQTFSRQRFAPSPRGI